jgi:hypothetical protein
MARKAVSRKELEQQAEQFLKKAQGIGGGQPRVADRDFQDAVQVVTERSAKTLRAQGVKIIS